MNFRQILLSTSRINKKIIAMLSDLASISIATLYALKVSNTELIFLGGLDLLRISWIPFLCLVTFWFTGVYSSIVRYMDLTIMFDIARALLIVLVINFFSKVFLFSLSFFTNLQFIPLITPEGWIIGFIVFNFFIFSSRLIANYFLNDRETGKRVVIYGAGSAGIQLSMALRVSKEMEPIAFLDSNTSLHDTFVGGIKVLDPSKLEKLVKRGKVDEVLIAIPSLAKSKLKSILKEIEKFAIKVRILPGLAELAQGKVLVSELKEVAIEDLLGRLEVEANQQLINKNIKDKVVLVTGAGGSIGSEISKQVARTDPAKIILFDKSEYALYSIRSNIEETLPNVEVYSILGDVTDKKRISDVLKVFNVDTVYHAAAYKHVPLVEENPFEAVNNNIFGTKVTAESAIAANVETFVLISTDKAVRPTNIMGATKRFAELILQSLSENSKTKMIMVRFGNVIGSSGSAIPLFQRQIEDGGPVTVTHPDVMRYFMSIPEAAELVIQAGAMGEGGDLFVLDMGEPVKIVELAKKLINLSGKELLDKNNPEGDIKIQFTGLRPGEKLYEELLIGGNVARTEHSRILRAQEDFLSSKEIDKYLNLILESEEDRNVDTLKEIFKETVSGFIPEEKNIDVVSSQQNQQI
jgi:FlaA1/EpsC-like NDP-sugar epimerase